MNQYNTILYWHVWTCYRILCYSLLFENKRMSLNWESLNWEPTKFPRKKNWSPNQCSKYLEPSIRWVLVHKCLPILFSVYCFQFFLGVQIVPSGMLLVKYATLNRMLLSILLMWIKIQPQAPSRVQPTQSAIDPSQQPRMNPTTSKFPPSQSW